MTRVTLQKHASRLEASVFLIWILFSGVSCGPRGDDDVAVVTFPGSAVGTEAEVLRRQLEAFMTEHPKIRVVQRNTPDAADQRHQLYVQWLNARASEPDILQLDVIWTAEFAAAGWLMPLDSFEPELDGFFPATITANRWQNTLYALPWFVDVGMLYWRKDLLANPPATFAELTLDAEGVQREGRLPLGFVWQGARYEGLVCVFLEYLGGFGGRILDESGRVTVDEEPAVRALTAMRDSIYRSGIVPKDVLTWQEEQTRFAFQNGQALFMRNWPYAYSLMEKPPQSRVRGKFSAALMPATPQGSPTAALGGSQLAINANSAHPAAAYAVIEYLTRPEQMLERARMAGQYPPRAELYQGDALAGALAVPPSEARRIIEHAVPRPVTPVYTELSQILQIHLHRALTRQETPEAALGKAANAVRRLLTEVGLDKERNLDAPL